MSTVVYSQETRIGVTVNKVAQSPASPQVAAKAKALVKKWKGAISPKEERSMSRACTFFQQCE